MPQFKSDLPKAQPRSLRSIAENKNGAGGFVHGVGPGEIALQNQPQYVDIALAAQPPDSQAVRGMTVADPRAFANMKGK